MQGYQLASGFCLILFSVIAFQTQFASASYSMSQTCKYYKEGYIADPDSCQSYGYCSGGALLGTQKCADGLLFDSRSGTCNYADKVTCSSKLESTCSVMTDPVYVQDPEDCTKACYCNGGKYSCVSCPKNQVFNPNTLSCVYSSQYACPANSICRLVPDNKFVGDPDTCGNYIQCSSGSGTSTPCPTVGYYYNPLSGYCINDASVCANSPAPSPSPSATGPGVAVPLPNDKSQCATPPTGYVEGPFFIEDGKTCMGYYSCDNENGPGTWFKCPMGTHFDQSKQQCVTPYSFACTHDRCGNIDQTFVSALGCKEYQYCINQTNQEAYGNACEDLNSKFPYFDEYQGACVDGEPNYEICKVSSPK